MPWGASDTNFGSKGALPIYDFWCRFRFEVPVANSRHPVQELQIGGTRAVTHKSGTLTDLAMSALPSEADIRASLQPVRFVPTRDIARLV
jgi:hypothetical protein